MTPLNPHEAQTGGSGFIRGLTMGLGVGLLVLVLGGAAGTFWVKRVSSNVRKGWNLVPVMVAAQDVPEDTVITKAMLSEQSLPEQFVTSSVVQPENASTLINQKLLVPVQKGDPFLWSQFETKKTQTVLFAKTDLTTGSTLSADDLEERQMGPQLLTPSWVRTEDRPQALGKKLLAPFRKGDPILWTHFEESHGAK